MAFVTIQVPDSVWEEYAEYNPDSPQTSMKQQLIRFAGVNPAQRCLLIPAAQRVELESLIGQQVETADELVSHIRRLCTVTVGGAEVPVTKGQMQRLNEQARFHGKDPREYLVQQAKDALSYAMGEPVRG